MQLLVIADDFTGALDTGIQFARHGIATTLFLSDALTAGLLADCQADVVVADTESRHLPPEDAAAWAQTRKNPRPVCTMRCSFCCSRARPPYMS